MGHCSDSTAGLAGQALPTFEGCASLTHLVELRSRGYYILLLPVVSGVEAEGERVVALRMDPLRFEVFCRTSRSAMPPT